VKGWSTQPLGDLCGILDSKRKPITKKDRIAGPYPYYGATGVLDFVAGFLFDEELVLVGEDGAKWGAGENTAFSVAGKVWVNNHAHVLRPNRHTLLDSWLIYYLNGSDLAPFITGLTVPKLNQAKLREIPVPLPPLAEQRRIVGVLDEAFAGLETLRANAEKNLNNVRLLFDSEVDTIFAKNCSGWTDKKIGDIAKTQYGLSISMNEEAKGYKIFRMGELQDGRLIDTGRMKYADISKDEFIKYQLRPDDILFKGIIPLRQVDRKSAKTNEIGRNFERQNRIAFL